MRTGYTVVDTLRGHYGKEAQRRMQEEVEAQVRRSARIFAGGSAGAVVVTRNDEGKVESTPALRRAQEEAREVPVSYRLYNEEDTQEVVGEVLYSLLVHDIPDSARLVEIFAEITDSEALVAAAQEGKLVGVGAHDKRVRKWVRRNLSRWAIAEEGKRIALTTCTVHGRTRARNLGEVVLALKRGKAQVASDRERDRILLFLQAIAGAPGVTVRVHSTGRTVTWRGHVKLITLRTLRRLQEARSRESGIDLLLVNEEGEEDLVGQGGDLRILVESGSNPTAQEVLEKSSLGDLVHAAQEAIRRFGALCGWQERRTEGTLVAFHHLCAGGDSATFAEAQGCTLRTAQKRIEDVRNALRPVLTEEDSLPWAEVLRVLVAS